MEEYTLTTGSKTALIIFTVLLFFSSLFSFTAIVPGNPGLIIIPLTSLMGSGLLITSMVRRKIIRYSDRVIYIGTLRKRELMLDEIKGYRKNAKVLILESVNEGKNIGINDYKSFRGMDLLISWIENTYPNLDPQDLKNNLEEVLKRSDLGVTPEDREKRLHKAKEIALAYNIWGGVLGFFTIFLTGKVATILLILLCTACFYCISN